MNDAWGLTATQWAAVAALGTAATALIAFVTAWFIFGQLRSARRQLADARRAQAEQERPYVIVSMDSSEVNIHFMDLVVQNVGKTPACNVRIHLDPPPARAQEIVGKELAKTRIFNKPLPLLPPGRTIRTFFDSGLDRQDTDLPNEYQVQVTYENSAGEQWDEKSVLDLDTLKGAMLTETFGMHHLAKAVREMNKHFKAASILGRRGHVETETVVEVRADRDERVAAEQVMRRRAYDDLVAEAKRAQDKGKYPSRSTDEQRAERVGSESWTSSTDKPLGRIRALIKSGMRRGRGVEPTSKNQQRTPD